MSDLCVFCDLIRDGSANWVAPEEHALAFEPFPEDTLAPGGTLVIPRERRDGLFGPSADALAEVMGLVRRVAAAMRDSLGGTGSFIIQASGRESG